MRATITRKNRDTPLVPPIVTGEVEARLIALARSTPLPGQDPPSALRPERPKDPT